MFKNQILNWINKNKEKIEYFSDEIYPFAPLNEEEFEKEVLSSLFETIDNFDKFNLVYKLVEYLNIYFIGKELELDEELMYKFLFGI